MLQAKATVINGSALELAAEVVKASRHEDVFTYCVFRYLEIMFCCARVDLPRQLIRPCMLETWHWLPRLTEASCFRLLSTALKPWDAQIPWSSQTRTTTGFRRVKKFIEKVQVFEPIGVLT